MADEPLSSDARTRAADWFEAFFGTVNAALAKRFPGADPQMVSDAATRAILQISKRPERHDPSRGSLERFLIGAAARLFRTLQRGERRRRQREKEKRCMPVTGSASAARTLLDDLVDREQVERVRAALRLTPKEEKVLDLWLLGERDPGAYAAALGLTDRPIGEQEKQSQRVLARLRQRLHRLGLRFRQEEQTET